MRPADGRKLVGYRSPSERNGRWIAPSRLREVRCFDVGMPSRFLSVAIFLITSLIKVVATAPFKAIEIAVASLRAPLVLATTAAAYS